MQDIRAEQRAAAAMAKRRADGRPAETRVPSKIPAFHGH